LFNKRGTALPQQQFQKQIPRPAPQSKPTLKIDQKIEFDQKFYDGEPPSGLATQQSLLISPTLTRSYIETTSLVNIPAQEVSTTILQSQIGVGQLYQQPQLQLIQQPQLDLQQPQISVQQPQLDLQQQPQLSVQQPQLDLQKTQQIQIPVQDLVQPQILQPTITTPTPTPPTPQPIGLLLPPPVEKQKTKPASMADFKVFARRFGVDKEIGTFQTKEAAKGKLFTRLTKTLAASGYITKGKTKLKVSDLGTLKEGFRKSKIDVFRVVEKKPKRLKKGTFETEEIKLFKGKGRKSKKNLFGI